MTDPAHELPQVKYAGFWRRLFAYVMDSAILMILFGGSAKIIEVPLTGSGFNATPEEITFSFASVVVTWLYFALMESSSRQATLGKMAIRLIVVDEEGKRISFARATGRHFGKIISGITLTIGYMMAGWTRKKQALHDIMAKTLVVQE